MAEVRLSAFVTSPVRTRRRPRRFEQRVIKAATFCEIEASDRCSRFGQTYCDALTDSAARPGDERDFTFETK